MRMYFAGDGVTCIDNDECELGTHDCDSDANCTNAPGSFVCLCKAGYSGDGVSCIDIDECGLNLCNDNVSCINLLGSFVCMLFFALPIYDYHDLPCQFAAIKMWQFDEVLRPNCSLK